MNDLRLLLGAAGMACCLYGMITSVVAFGAIPVHRKRLIKVTWALLLTTWIFWGLAWLVGREQ